MQLPSQNVIIVIIKRNSKVSNANVWFSLWEINMIGNVQNVIKTGKKFQTDSDSVRFVFDEKINNCSQIEWTQIINKRLFLLSSTLIEI